MSRPNYVAKRRALVDLALAVRDYEHELGPLGREMASKAPEAPVLRAASVVLEHTMTPAARRDVDDELARRRQRDHEVAETRKAREAEVRREAHALGLKVSS